MSERPKNPNKSIYSSKWSPKSSFERAKPSVNSQSPWKPIDQVMQQIDEARGGEGVWVRGSGGSNGRRSGKGGSARLNESAGGHPGDSI